MTIVKFHRPVARTNGFPFVSQMMSEMLERMDNSRFSADGWDTFPRTNVIENETEFVLQIAVPGMNKEHFSIDIEKDVLTLSASKDQNESDELNYLRREFDYSSFSKTFRLPETVDSEKINANYENGILTVSLCKKDSAIPQPPRKIEVK
jgi:HSP20 family protein